MTTATSAVRLLRPIKTTSARRGEARLRAELLQLLDVERPIVVEGGSLGREKWRPIRER